jgi:hypothetical protein
LPPGPPRASLRFNSADLPLLVLDLAQQSQVAVAAAFSQGGVLPAEVVDLPAERATRSQEPARGSEGSIRVKPCNHPDGLLRPLPVTILAVEIGAAWTCESCGGAVIRLNPPPSHKRTRRFAATSRLVARRTPTGTRRRENLQVAFLDEHSESRSLLPPRGGE